MAIRFAAPRSPLVSLCAMGPLVLLATPLVACGPEGAPCNVSATRDLAPVVPDADRAELASDTAAFATAMFAGVKNDPRYDGNFVLSPYGLEVKLAMEYSGARGQTAEEMAAAAHLTLPQERLHPALDALDLALATKRPELTFSRSFWGDTDKDYECDAVSQLVTHYGAEVWWVDFDADRGGSVDAIGKWLATKTGGKITTSDPEAYANQYGMGYELTNDAYLHAVWSLSDAQPVTDMFHGRSGDASAAFFVATGSVGYAATDTYEAFDLPFAGAATSLLVVMPKDGSYADVEDAFGADMIAGAASTLAPRTAQLEVPSFHFSPHPLGVGQELQALGMHRAFDPKAAEFGFMKDGSYLVDVFDQSALDIDATGASGGLVIETNGQPSSSGAVTASAVRIDRPFLFAIRDLATGTLFFLGRIVDPTA
jgi:serpin B